MLCVLVANEDDFWAGRRPDGIITRKMRAMAGQDASDGGGSILLPQKKHFLLLTFHLPQSQ
jgi:hypothetical protein